MVRPLSNTRTMVPSIEGTGGGPEFSLDVRTRETEPSTEEAGEGSRLPLEIILMILEELSYDEIFLFEGQLLEEVMLNKLNHNHRLEGRHLYTVAEHPGILHRVTRLNIHCVEEKHNDILENILAQCPNFRFMTLKLGKRSRLQHLLNYHHILQLSTKLTVYIFEEESIPSLEHICRRCPLLDLELRVVKFSMRLKKFQQILSQLKRLKVSCNGVEDLLPDPTYESSPIRVKLSIECLQILLGHPEIFDSLARLSMTCKTDEDISKLNEICAKFPTILKSRFQVKKGLHGKHSKIVLTYSCV